MKLCFFDFITLVGGATKGTVYLLERLKKQGIDSEVINAYGVCSEYISDLENSNIKYTILSNNISKTTIGFKNSRFRRFLEIFIQFPTYLKIFLRLFFSIFKIKPTHIMVNNRKSLFFIIPLKFLLNFKIILYYRVEGKKNQLPQPLVSAINKFVDVVFCHSEIAISNMKKYGVNKDIQYLPNCVKIDNIITKKKKIDLTVFKIFLNAGRIVREKGYHTAIYALNELKNKKYNIILTLPGIVTDQVYFEELLSFINDNELTDNIIFCGWVDKIQQEIYNSDCMILPSHTEGFPRSVIESMFLKVPVCATPVGGIPEAIIDEETGFLFDVDDYLDLANKVELLITNKDKRNFIVENAYNFARQNFDESSNTQIFINSVNLNG